MSDDDQDEGRSAEAKVGATKTLLGEAIERHLSRQKAVMGQQVSLFADVDPLPDDEQPGTAVSKGRGRPPGARNKGTEAFRAFVRARYGDPMIKLMERAFADPKVLAAALGLDAGDVWIKQNELLMRLMPFLHSAMPAEIKVQAKGSLAVAIGVAPGALQPGDQVVEIDPVAALMQIMENQGLSIETAAPSNAAPSNDDPVLFHKSKG
jgi:hypothetical protein